MLFILHSESYQSLKLYIPGMNKATYRGPLRAVSTVQARDCFPSFLSRLPTLTPPPNRTFGTESDCGAHQMHYLFQGTAVFFLRYGFSLELRLAAVS